jgi:hypothetical protein
MGVFVAWLCLAFIVGYFGKSKNIGFGKAFFWSLILSPLVGLVIVLFSSEPMQHQYAPHYEAAKKFEAIGKTSDAVLKYKETAYHLENDYKNVKLSKGDDKQRLKMIDQIKAKISELEGQDSDAKSSE